MGNPANCNRNMTTKIERKISEGTANYVCPTMFTDDGDEVGDDDDGYVSPVAPEVENSS